MSLLKKIFLLILLILTSFTAPQATAQQENDDGGDLLIITVPIIAAGAMRRYQACLDEMQPGCENTYLYCVMTVEEKISYQLQLCYDQKNTCYSACDEAYEECCAQSGLPECPDECLVQKNACMAACDTQGDQCVLDAISGNYDPPNENECRNDLDECLENAQEFCRKGSVSP